MRLQSLFPYLIFISCFGVGTLNAETTSEAGNVQWQVLNQWQLPDNPVDIVHSLDGKYVFILTNQQKVLIYSSQGNLEGSVPVDSGVKAIDIAPRAEMLYLIDSEKKSFAALSIDFFQNINTKGSPLRGPENAPVTIVLFTDFECPYCRKIEPLLKQVLEQNKETVKLVFKNMPLQFHQFADASARAALAAGEQGKFWEFHDELFNREAINDKVIEEIAVNLALDIDKWKNDMNSPVTRQKINIDLQDAQLAGVTGTPTLFVNGRLLKNRSLQGFQESIDAELNKKQ